MPDVYTIVHLNDIAAPESIAYLIKYDSIHGTWGPEVEYRDGYVIITEGERSVKIAISQEKDASKVRIRITPAQRNMCRAVAMTGHHHHTLYHGRLCTMVNQMLMSLRWCFVHSNSKMTLCLHATTLLPNVLIRHRSLLLLKATFAEGLVNIHALIIVSQLHGGLTLPPNVQPGGKAHQLHLALVL
jgi:hypothetical protein